MVPALGCQNASGQVVRGSLIESGPSTNSPAANVTSPKQPAPPRLSANLAVPQIKDGYLQIGFDKLAGFSAFVRYVPVKSDPPALFEAVAPVLTEPIPAAIQALDKRKVAVKGFMLPLAQENGAVTEFVLLRNRAFCCFGKPPGVNEWIHVRMTNKTAKPIMDRVVTAYGTLKVGEVREGGYLVAIYEMDGERLVGPSD